MSKSIQAIQEEIIQDFSILDGDMEMSNFYLMDLGQKLPDLDPELMNEGNLVSGCQSKVWLDAELRDDRVYYVADSNTAITKGLVSLLIRIFSGQRPEDIINADIFFPDKIGMGRFVGTQRSNGFAAMIKQFKIYAVAFKSKLNVK